MARDGNWVLADGMKHLHCLVADAKIHVGTLRARKVLGMTANRIRPPNHFSANHLRLKIKTGANEVQ